MFAAAGNHVSTLHRESVGGLELPADLEEGAWRIATTAEIDRVFSSNTA
jgi:16S rRNA pseudouridine516 synthase